MQPDHDHDDGLREQVRVVGDDDDRVLLDEVDELLQLVHPRLEPLAPVLLGQGVGQEGQTLVLVVQVRPVGPETLKPNAESTSILSRFTQSIALKGSYKVASFCPRFA